MLTAPVHRLLDLAVIISWFNMLEYDRDLPGQDFWQKLFFNFHHNNVSAYFNKCLR
jgi:hypothetical protein